MPWKEHPTERGKGKERGEGRSLSCVEGECIGLKRVGEKEERVTPLNPEIYKRFRCRGHYKRSGTDAELWLRESSVCGGGDHVQESRACGYAQMT